MGYNEYVDIRWDEIWRWDTVAILFCDLKSSGKILSEMYI